MYEAEFKGLPRVQREPTGREESRFQRQWNNLELLESGRASNSCQPNETPQTLLINLHVRVGDRLQVGVSVGSADCSVGDSATTASGFFFSFTTIMWHLGEPRLHYSEDHHQRRTPCIRVHVHVNFQRDTLQSLILSKVCPSTP